MSKLNKIFQSVPVKIPDRSGFDLSHEVLTTALTGTLVPATCFEVLPGDTISLGSAMKVTLPPFAVPFMGRVDACLEAFFVPYRQLWQGWQSFITQNDGTNPGTAKPTVFQVGDNPVLNVPVQVPSVVSELTTSDYFGPGTLADYLGVKNSTIAEGLGISALPFLAYHKICDHWYRDQNLTKPFFPKAFAHGYQGLAVTPDSFAATGRFLPSVANWDSFNSAPYHQMLVLNPLRDDSWFTDESIVPFDTKLGLGSLRQRCWAKDYFTSATPQPQAGALATVSFDTSGNIGEFTIASLRAANSLQRWMEINNLGGTEYGSQILAHFGVMPPDAVINEPILLGSVRENVFVGSVENNSNASQPAGGKNPFGVLGSAAGFGSSGSRGSLVDEFHAKEHGLIMVMFSLVPHAYYNTGIERYLRHLHVGDFAFPEFANIGDQPIFNNELYSESEAPLGVFGYNQRYSEYKALNDRVSGLLEEGQNLSVYALKRTFDTIPQLSTEFVEIPTDFLDPVFAVTTKESGYSCMLDAFFDARVLRVLPEYSLPCLK